MTSADVKTNKKQQKIKDLVAVYCNFSKKYPQNLKYNVKESVFSISFLLAFHPSSHCSLATGGGEGGHTYLLYLL